MAAPGSAITDLQGILTTIIQNAATSTWGGAPKAPATTTVMAPGTFACTGAVLNNMKTSNYYQMLTPATIQTFTNNLSTAAQGQAVAFFPLVAKYNITAANLQALIARMQAILTQEQKSGILTPASLNTILNQGIAYTPTPSTVTINTSPVDAKACSSYFQTGYPQANIFARDLSTQVGAKLAADPEIQRILGPALLAQGGSAATPAMVMAALQGGATPATREINSNTWWVWVVVIIVIIIIIIIIVAVVVANNKKKAVLLAESGGVPLTVV